MKSSRDYAWKRSRYPAPYEPYSATPSPYGQHRPYGSSLPSPLPRDSYNYSTSSQLPPPLPRYNNSPDHHYHRSEPPSSYYHHSNYSSAPYSTSAPYSFGPKFTLYIGNVDYAASWKDLKDFIKSFGFFPLRVDIPYHPGSFKPKGFGIVEVNSREALEDMINKMNDKEFYGRRLQVREDFKSIKFPHSGPLSNPPHHHHTQTRGPQNTKDPECVLVLLNIPKNYAWQELKDLLRPIVPPTRVDVIRNNEEDITVGVAEFATKDQALSVIDFLKDAKVEDKEITILFRNDPNVPEFLNQNSPNTFRANPSNLPIRKLYIGQLAWTVTRNDLFDLFKEAGEIKLAQVVSEPNQYMKDGRPKSKGYGFIEYANPEEAEKAIEMFNNKEFHGRNIQVRYDREDPSLKY